MQFYSNIVVEIPLPYPAFIRELQSNMAFFQSRCHQSFWAAVLLLSAPLTVSIPVSAAPEESPDSIEATPVATAPAELSAMIEQMDQVANSQRLKSFMRFFDKSLTHGDGLNHRQLQQAVRTFWKQFDQLSYTTELDAWKELSPGVYETETTTTITGKQSAGIPAPKTLTATIRAKQTVQSNRITAQTILDEQSQVVSGTKPPTVQINLPKTVSVGEEYFFDVIMNEPLGDRILLGAAIEESVVPQSYLSPSKFEIQSLATGGLFKIGQAPEKPMDQWISALLIQDGGMYMMSQRVTVLPSKKTAVKKSVSP